MILVLDLVLDLVLGLVLGCPQTGPKTALKNPMSQKYRFRGMFSCINPSEIGRSKDWIAPPTPFAIFAGSIPRNGLK